MENKQHIEKDNLKVFKKLMKSIEDITEKNKAKNDTSVEDKEKQK